MFRRIVAVLVLSIAISFPIFVFGAEEGAASSAASSSAAAPASSAEEPKRGTFLDPVLVWQREFDPPLSEISAKNSGGEYIAVQLKPDEEKGYAHGRILFLNSRGETVRTIELGQEEKRLIKREDAWLTFWAASQNNPHILRDYQDGRWITTVTSDAYVSGNGEYYAILARDLDHESPWYEFAYYDRTGKLLWTARPQMNYYNYDVYISHNGSRVLLVDSIEVDIFGQKWYLFDSEGHLLRTSIEDKPWIRKVDLSPNGEYIAYATNKKLALMDKDGNVIWETERASRNTVPILNVFNNGIIAVDAKVFSATGAKICDKCYLQALFPNNKNALGWEITDDPVRGRNFNIYNTSDGHIDLILPGRFPLAGEARILIQFNLVVDANHVYRILLEKGDRLRIMLIDIDILTWTVRNIKGNVLDGIAMSVVRLHSGELLITKNGNHGIKRVHYYDVSRGVGE